MKLNSLFSIAMGVIVISLPLSFVCGQTTKKELELDKGIQIFLYRHSHQIFLDRVSQQKYQNTENRRLIQALSDWSHLKKENPRKYSDLILLLGDRKAVEAIPHLIDLLDFRYKFDWEGTGVAFKFIPPGGYYPATDALYSIGNASLPALIKVIEMNNSQLKRKNAAYSVRIIYRSDLWKGVEYLKQAKSNSRTPEGKINLQKAIEKIEQDAKCVDKIGAGNRKPTKITP